MTNRFEILRPIDWEVASRLQLLANLPRNEQAATDAPPEPPPAPQPRTSLNDWDEV